MLHRHVSPDEGDKALRLMSSNSGPGQLCACFRADLQTMPWTTRRLSWENSFVHGRQASAEAALVVNLLAVAARPY